MVEVPVGCDPRRSGRSHHNPRRVTSAVWQVARLWLSARRTLPTIGHPHVPRPQVTDAEAFVASLLTSGQPVRLHLACGKRHLPGWIHIDIDDWPHVDLRQPAEDLSMFPDGSVDVIYNCHQIAYYDRTAAMAALREWYRVLRPGGVLRLATADFASVVSEYAAGRPVTAFDGLLYGRYPVQVDSARRLGPPDGGTSDAPTRPIFYRATYDFDTLADLLRQVSFTEVRRYDWRATDHADVDDYAQAYLPHLDKVHGRLMSLNVEAVK